MRSDDTKRAVLHLRVRDARKVPWKNGRGTTREIALWPEHASFEREDFEWRIACASVTAAGAFSLFPRHERLIVVTRGDGLVIEHGDAAPRARVRALEPYRFPGAWPTSAELARGPVEDLNVMWDADRARVDVEVVRLGRRRWMESVGPGHALAHLVAGRAAVRVSGEEEPIELAAGESVWIQGMRGEDELELAGTAEDAVALVVRIAPV